MFTNNQVTRLSNPVLNWYQRPISFGAYIICIYIYIYISFSVSLTCLPLPHGKGQWNQSCQRVLNTSGMEKTTCISDMQK